MEKKEFLYMTAQMSNRGRDMEKRIRIISQKKKTAVWIVILFCLLCIIAIGITSGKKQTKQQSETVKTTSQRETALPSPTDNFHIKKAYVENERISFGDFTQDGVEDFIDVAMDKVKNPKDDELDTVVLKSGRTGKTLWGLPVNTVHAGWYGVYAYGEKDKRYLLVFQPTMYQGMADFKYKIFTVDESGKETVLHSDQIQFNLNHPKKTDFVSFENFVEKLNQYLKQSELVISTLEGTVLTEENTPSDLTYDPTEILQEMKQDGQ